MRYLKASLLVGVAVLILAWLVQSNREPQVVEYPIQRTIKYNFTVENPTNRFMESVEFWSYAPLQTTSIQQVRGIKTSTPYRSVVDKEGNQRLYFTITKLPPYGSRTVSVAVDLGLREQPAIMDGENITAYLEAEPYIESDDPRIQKIAAEQKGKHAWNTAENTYEWVSEHVKEAGYVASDQGALYALEKKVGDCTESAYLFAALSRANNIPTRIMAGYVYGQSAILKSADYHNWPEVYLDGTWWVADPNKKNFRKQQSHYIATNIVSRSDSTTRESQRFFGTDDSVRIVML